MGLRIGTQTGEADVAISASEASGPVVSTPCPGTCPPPRALGKTLRPEGTSLPRLPLLAQMPKRKLHVPSGLRWSWSSRFQERGHYAPHPSDQSLGAAAFPHTPRGAGLAAPLPSPVPTVGLLSAPCRLHLSALATGRPSMSHLRRLPGLPALAPRAGPKAQVCPSTIPTSSSSSPGDRACSANMC